MTVTDARTATIGVVDRDERAIYLAFAGLAFCSIFLQKFGLRFGDSALALNSIAMWGVLGWLVATQRAGFVVARLVLFFSMMVLMLVSVLLNGQDLKAPALGLICLMYAAFAVRIDVSEDLARTCILAFQKMMIVVVWIVIAQQAIQYTIGNAYWPNLDNMFPSEFLIPGFAYMRPLSWQSPYNTPNGVFFLEPSSLSYCLALSFAFELVMFRNFRRLTLFGVGLVACMAATGPISLICTAPWWIMKTDKRIRALIILVGLPCVGLAIATGAIDHALDRTAELGTEGSSGYLRLIAPMKVIYDQIVHAEFMLTGWGPGAAPEGHNIVTWPMSKLLFEYGLATALMFHLYLLVCVLSRPPARIVIMTALLPFLFLGAGPTSHVTVLAMVLFGSLLNTVADPKPARPRSIAAPRPEVSSWGSAASPAAQQ